MSLKLGNLKIKSDAFVSGRIPKRNAGDGENLSPPLEWSGAPQGTLEFALVCHDPDAPLVQGFTHWVLYGIPATTTKLAEGQKPDTFAAGLNGMGKPGRGLYGRRQRRISARRFGDGRHLARHER